MKLAGIREARQHLSVLLEEVRKGREIGLTSHGHLVARLVPVESRRVVPFHSHRKFRQSIILKGVPLSETVAEDRDDRV